MKTHTKNDRLKIKELVEKTKEEAHLKEMNNQVEEVEPLNDDQMENEQINENKQRTNKAYYVSLNDIQNEIPCKNVLIK